MRKESKKSEEKGFLLMKPRTRSFFLTNFYRDHKYIDSQKAADFFGVTTRTINNWWASGCPNWVDNYVELYQRAIPDTKDWDGFKFVEGRLYTPYDKLTFAPSELMKIFYDRQFNRLDRVHNKQLTAQVDELRNDEEAAAIREELDHMINTLNKLKVSPIVAPKMDFATKLHDKPKR